MREFVIRGGGHDRSADSGTESEENGMTTEELYDWIRNELGEMRALYYEGSHALHEEIKKLTEPAPAGDEKLYTASEIIRLVQETISEEICGLDDGGMLVAYEVERGIIRKLVKEEDT